MDTKTNVKKKPGAPQWSVASFERFLEQSETLMRLMSLSTRGIFILKGAPNVIEILAKGAKLDGGETSKRVAEAKEMAQMAQEEIDNDFPLLHNQALITMWAFLEGTIKSFVCEWIKHTPEIYKIEVFKKLKIELGEYEILRPEEKASYIYYLYEKEISRGEPYGYSRFEKILEPLGLGGPVPRKISGDLFSLAQIRNALVHRGGIADYQLLNKCPNLKFEVGKEINISSKMLKDYFGSLHQYIVLLICRVGSSFGTDMTEISDPILNSKDQKMTKVKKLPKTRNKV